MGKKIIAIILLIASIIPCYSQQDSAFHENKNTIEVGFNADFLNNGFGNWYAGRIKYTRKLKKCTFFLEPAYLHRKKCGGGAFIMNAGLYVDWAQMFYTFSSISAGTDVWYSPKIRADLDLNFKLGKKKDWVITLGGTYVDFYSEQSVAIGSLGLTYYGTGFIMSGRLFYNTCFPGKKTSFTGLLSVDQGYVYKYMNTIAVSYGNQSYQTLDWGNLTNVDRRAFSVSFMHRNWIRKNWGLLGQAGFVYVSKAYNVWSVSVGAFWSF